MECLVNFTVWSAVQFNAFLRDNAWWIALLICLLILAILVLFLVLKPHKKKEAKSEEAALKKEACSLDALGGKENVLSHTRKGSRIEIALADAKKVDQEALKGMGVSSFILMSNKLTLVVEKDPEEVEKAFFGE